MNDAVTMDVAIADLQVSEISDKELEDAFRRVLVERKDAIASIQRSMKDADEVYRKYLNEDYEPLEDVAKKDRAKLNSAEKNIAEKYASLRAAYERPLQTIDENIRMIRKAIKNASGVVDGAVKSYEEKQKSAKRKEIQAYFDAKNFDLVSLDKIFDEKWLNKGAKMKDVRERIDEDIADIYRDIEVLEKIPEHGMTAKAIYLEKLDMGAALRQVEVLKENAERLAREQVAREERKISEQVANNAASERKETQEAARVEKVQSLVDSALEFPRGTPAARAQEEIIEITLAFKGTREKLRKLREYMTENGIPYTKVLLLDNENDALQIMKQRNLIGKICSAIRLRKMAA